MDINAIQLVECREEYLLLSAPISCVYDDNDMAILTGYAREQRKHRIFSYSYGTMFEWGKASSQGIVNERFFIRVDKPSKHTYFFNYFKNDFEVFINVWDIMGFSVAAITAIVLFIIDLIAQKSVEKQRSK